MSAHDQFDKMMRDLIAGKLNRREPLVARPDRANAAAPKVPAQVWTANSRPPFWHGCALPCMSQQAARHDDTHLLQSMSSRRTRQAHRPQSHRPRFNRVRCAVTELANLIENKSKWSG